METSSHWIDTQGEYRGIAPGRRIAHDVNEDGPWVRFELPKGCKRRLKRNVWQRIERGEVKP